MNTLVTPLVDPLPIVVYLSRPNRYDIANNKLLSGPPGDFLQTTLRDLSIDPAKVTYTTNHAYRFLGQHTSIFLGNFAHSRLAPYFNRSLNESRGLIANNGRGECVSTFDPVDCTDVISHEPESFDDEDEEESDKSGSTYKDSAPTQRTNYRFWFRADLEKLLTPYKRRRTYKYETVFNFSTEQLISWLNSQSGIHLYFDIETHPATETIQCFTIAAFTGPVFVVPIYDHRGNATHNLPRLFAALTKAFSRNTIVGHNISFDLGFLFHFHGVPFSHRTYDTMLAHHRCFPEVEKSLAHTMSYWGNFPLHKSDAGTFHPYNSQQFRTLLEYNARDVLVLREIHLEQCKYAKGDTGLRDSITEVNESTYPYLIAGFTGFNVNIQLARTKMAKLKVDIDNLLRVLRVLTGAQEFNPNSPDQVGKWLYADGLNYPVLDRTETGNPKTDMKTLYSLIIKFPKNLALRLLIMFKEQDKVRGMLSFEHYYINESR